MEKTEEKDPAIHPKQLFKKKKNLGIQEEPFCIKIPSINYIQKGL